MIRSAIPSILVAALIACGPSPRPQGPNGGGNGDTNGSGTDTTDPGQSSSETPMQPQTFPQQTATPQALAFPEDAFRTKQPTGSKPRPFKLPRVQRLALDNGIKVWLVEQHDLPIVTLDLNFDGGSMTDPDGKEGLASLCMSMLTEGTEALDKIHYAEALADVASRINAYALEDSTGLTMSTLSKHFDTTYQQFIATLRSPGFRAPDFDRMVKRRIESVRQSKGSAGSVAARVSDAVLYGADHPFGEIVTEKSLQGLTVDDCKSYVGSHLKPRGARLFVVGDFTPAQVKQYFSAKKIAGWTGAGARIPATPRPQTMKGRIFFINIPHAAQSQVMAMHFGPSRRAPDYFANTVMASVLGGGFTSRLNMNLREDKGYSYGARGGFGYNQRYGVFRAGASVRTDSTYQTLLEIDHEIKDLWNGKAKVTADELAREKESAILSLPGRFATGQAALGQYRRLVYFGLPLNYFNSYVAKIGRVSAAQVTAAARRHLKPGQAVYLVVGDGDAQMKVRNGDKDVPYVKDGKPMTLRAALTDLAARGDVGTGGLVELDVDGHVVGR